MNNIQDTGVKRINFEIPSELHRKLKAKFSSEGRTFKGVLLPFMAACVERDGIPQLVSANGNPGAEPDPLEKKINELLEVKLSGSEVKTKDGLSPLKEYSVEPVVHPEAGEIDGAEVDPEDKTYRLEDPEDKVYRTKPDGKSIASVDEIVRGERDVKAENGLIATGKKVSLSEKVVAQRRIIGKMIILAEQAKRGYFDWFRDGGSYTVVTAEERDAELAEREKDRLAEGKKEIEDGEEL